MISQEQLKLQCEAALDFAAYQVKNLVAKHPGLYPEFTVNGVWSPNKNPWTNWCEGFTPGQKWILHRFSASASAGLSATAPRPPGTGWSAAASR